MSSGWKVYCPSAFVGGLLLQAAHFDCISPSQTWNLSPTLGWIIVLSVGGVEVIEWAHVMDL
jgi:hypothetical protein